jgi:hypothetical protein
VLSKPLCLLSLPCQRESCWWFPYSGKYGFFFTCKDNENQTGVQRSSPYILFTDLDGILGHQINKRLESFAPCYSQSLLLADCKENHTLLWFTKLHKKSAKKENSSRLMNNILLNWKMWVKNQTKTRVWEVSSLCPETSTKNTIQEFQYIVTKKGQNPAKSGDTTCFWIF